MNKVEATSDGQRDIEAIPYSGEPAMEREGLELAHFIQEVLKINNNLLKFITKLKSPKTQSVFAQAGKPVPPGFLPSGELSGLVMSSFFGYPING